MKKAPKKSKKNSKLQIALVQMACSTNVTANLDKAVKLIEQAAAKGAKIIALQELFRTQYFCQKEDSKLFDLAEPIPGPSTERLAVLARGLGVVIIASLFEKRSAGLYHNTAVVIDADGKILGKYRKMHIPEDPGFYEKFYFTPGDLGFQTFKTKFAQIGTLICWDQWFPEAARLTALAGAQILFYPTAIGWKLGRADEARKYHAAWETIQRGHAIANGVYVAAANRVGREGAFEFWGGSFVAGPFGDVVKRAGAKEEIILADVDLGLVDQTRREWPFLRDRRIDSYRAITSRLIE